MSFGTLAAGGASAIMAAGWQEGSARSCAGSCSDGCGLFACTAHRQRRCPGRRNSIVQLMAPLNLPRKTPLLVHPHFPPEV